MKNLLCAIALSTIISGCEKIPQDTPPKVKIITPIDGKMYDSNIITIQWEIDEENLKNVWCSVNNDEKFPLYAKSGSLNWYFGNGDNKLVIGAENYSHSSKDSVRIYAGNLIK